MHGHPAVDLEFTGWQYQPGDRSPQAHASDDHQEERRVLVPLCVAADLVGSLLAHVAHYKSPEAATAFLDSVTEHRAQTEVRLAELAAEGRDCCTEGFLTGGQEHTCGRTNSRSEPAPPDSDGA
ncbi:hypothetical protein [Streptomyces sp. NBC_00670]|jgi:hypothetical protein|uniref:hypothetical protein n=1 Tax=Streptomyces sp. NBC_00670 TaxID=2975804 RepID=UPI002E2F1A61|nr:hypothetical protein [Streptomyces sp. NBC_00670]